MNAIGKVFHWGDTHHPGYLDILRVTLGVILFYKGVEFGRDGRDLRNMIEGTDFSLLTFFLNEYIPLVHLAGGVLIVFGLITRWAIVFQLPVLIGAVILTGRGTGMFDSYGQFWLSAITLILLVVFLIIGSGKFSMDGYLEKYPNG